MTGCILAFPREEDLRAVRSVLVRNGFTVLASVSTGDAVLSRAEKHDGVLVICAYRFRDMVCTELRRSLPARHPMLLICSPARLTETLPEGLDFLPLPLKSHELVRKVRHLTGRPDGHRSAPRTEADRRSIARAKELLMARQGMTEEDAHRYLQRRSMENGVRLSETAEMVLRLYGQEENHVQSE